jgi:WD40 repeat protein
MALILAVSLIGEGAAKEPVTLPQGGAAYSLSFSADGKLLAVGCSRFTSRVWDVVAQKQVGEVAGAYPVLSPDGKVIAARTPKGATLWDVGTWKELGTLHDAVLSPFAFSPDGKTLAAGDNAGRVCLWDVAKKEVIANPEPNPVDRVRIVTFSPDGKTLAYITIGGTVTVYDVASRKVVATLKGYSTSDQALAFTSDSKILIYAERRRQRQNPPQAKLWDVAAGKVYGEMPLPTASGNIRLLHRLEDGKTWLVWSDGRKDLQFIDPDKKTYSAVPMDIVGWQTRAMIVSPNGKYLAMAIGSDVKIYDVPKPDPTDWKKYAK